MTTRMPLARVCLLAALLLSTLVACADTVPEAPAQTPGVLPTAEDKGAPATTPADGAQPTGAPAQPAPAAQAPTAAPSGPALVGPEWTIAASGDANGDGKRDVIAYKPASVAPRSPDPAYPLTVSEVAIVQEGAAGQPEPQIIVKPQEIIFLNQPSISFPTVDPLTTPAAFLLSVTATGGAPLNIIPLNAGGDPFMQGFGVAWDGNAAGYRLAAGGQTQPTATPPQPSSPLVGPEWTIAAAGDVNSDGKRDVIAYKPVPIIPRRPDPTFPLIASEMVIVQERDGGSSEILLAITPAEIWVPGQSLLGYGGAPAGFMLNAAPGGAVPVTVIPLNTNGDAIAQRAELLWSRDEQGYRLTARTQPVATATPPLVGNEWTIAAAGDVNADGRRDVIAYKPAPITAKQPDPAYPLVVSEVVIVQEGPAGGPELLFAIKPQQISAPGQTLLAFPAGNPATMPAAFQLNVAVGTGVPVSVIPINANGDNYTQGVAVTWDSSQQGYRLISGGQPLPVPPPSAAPPPPPAPTALPTAPPTPASAPAAATAPPPPPPPSPTSPPAAPPTSTAVITPTGVPAVQPTGVPAVQPTITPVPVGPPAARPLVGDEWTIAAAGDANSDGKRDVIAYKPAAVTPKLHNLLYPLAVSEVVIVQEGADGNPELLLNITPQQIIAPGQALLAFPTGDPVTTPAAFQLRVTSGDPVPVSVIPINANGDNYTQGIGITWNPEQQGYRLASGR